MLLIKVERVRRESFGVGWYVLFGGSLFKWSDKFNWWFKDGGIRWGLIRGNNIKE